MVGVLWIMLVATTAPEPVRLAPAMPAVAAPGVPMLYDPVPDADRVQKGLRIEPAQPYRWIADPGGSVAIRCRATVEAKGTGAVLTVWDWHNRPVHLARFPVPFDETVTFAVAGRGSYMLTLDLMDGTKCTARLARSFAATADASAKRGAWRQSGFFVGGCSYPGRQHWSNDYGPATPPGITEQASRELDAELSARMGLQVIRFDPPVEWPGEDKPIDWSRADASARALTARGFRLAIQLDPAPDWAVLDAYRDRKDPLWRYPHREGPVRRIAAEVARRYGKDAALFEVWNEPDNPDFWRGTVAEYADYARWCIEEIRKAAPGVPICNGGYTLIEPEETGAIARMVTPLSDWTAYHFHGMPEDLPAAFGAYRAIQAAAGAEKSVFANTEMGYAAWRLDVERNMAASIVSKILFSWANGHRGAILYCTRDVGGPRQRPDPDWGCLDYTFCPRHAYAAVAALCDVMAGLQPTRTHCEKRPLFAYEFAGADRRVVVLFAPDEGGRKVSIRSDATGAEIVDVMGNATGQPDPGNVAAQAWLYPTYVVLRGATKVVIEGAP